MSLSFQCSPEHSQGTSCNASLNCKYVRFLSIIYIYTRIKYINWQDFSFFRLLIQGQHNHTPHGKKHDEGLYTCLRYPKSQLCRSEKKGWAIGNECRSLLNWGYRFGTFTIRVNTVVYIYISWVHNIHISVDSNRPSKSKSFLVSLKAST